MPMKADRQGSDGLNQIKNINPLLLPNNITQDSP